MSQILIINKTPSNVYKNHDEFEVPLDFEEIKRSPKNEESKFIYSKKYLIVKDDITEDKIEQIVTEETVLYDPSYYICDEIYNFAKYLEEYKVLQVLPLNTNDDYLIVGLEIIDNNNVNTHDSKFFQDLNKEELGKDTSPSSGKDY